MVKTTRAQREAIYRKWTQCPSPLPRSHELHETLSYKRFRKTALHGDYGAVVLQWCGMWLLIEADGYTHS